MRLENFESGNARLTDGASLPAIGGILHLAGQGINERMINRPSMAALGLASDGYLLAQLTQPPERQPGASDTRAMLVSTDAPPPAGTVAADRIHSHLSTNTAAFRSDMNSSNEIRQLIRGPAEALLRTLTAFQWDGTGITQHARRQREIPARANVINPAAGADGLIQVGPPQWSACFTEVQAHRDQLNRKWANCAEQAASMCHVISEMIRTDPGMAGCQVRQVYSNGHSWAEVLVRSPQNPNGEVYVYDPWRGIYGRAADPLLAPSYRDANKRFSSWYPPRAGG